MKPFVTLSASYGAGGSEVGPELARRLEVPFFDRAIPVQVAERLGTSEDDPLLQEDRPVGWFERMLSSLSMMGGLYGAADVLPMSARTGVLTEQDYRAEVLRAIIGAAESVGGGVLLGHGGAVVLAANPSVLHVRLDGPASRRARRASEQLGIDESEASSRLRRNDRAREGYVRRLYGIDPDQSSLYHVTIDSTVIGFEDCIELIVLAVTAHSRHLLNTA